MLKFEIVAANLLPRWFLERRMCALCCWCLCSGSRSGAIHQHDVRVASHHVGSFLTHSQEVCGLQWSSDGRYLASGANDNLLCIWDQTAGSNSSPLFTFSQHQAAVKVHFCKWYVPVVAFYRT